MTSKKEKVSQIVHPIQLISLNVLELFIRVKKPVKSKDLQLTEEDFTIRTGHSDYDEKKHIIEVAVRLEIGEGEDTRSPFMLRIVLGGVFTVDEAKFPKERITDWAKQNAPIILYPYLREQAFSLTVRCGYPGIILPLLTVPTFKIESGKKIKTVKVKA
jgi:preprotein translocase subunit SecB